MYKDKALWVILGAALLFRLVAAAAIEPLSVSGDEGNWNGVARAFLISGVAHADPGTYWPPLYPLLLAGIYRLFPGGPDTVQGLQAVLGSLTCAASCWVGWRIGGRAVGLVSAAACAVYPFFILFSAAILAETLLIFLVCAALVAFVLAADSPSTLRCAWLGFLLGLGALAKPVVLAWAVLLMPGLWRCAGPAVRQRATAVALVVGAAAITILPWTARNYAISGRLVLISSNLGMNLVIGSEPSATGVYRHGAPYQAMVDSLTGSTGTDEVDRDRSATRYGLNQLVADPVRTARLAAVKLAWLWGPLIPGEPTATSLLLAIVYLPLLVLGATGLWCLRGSAPAWGIVSQVVALSLVHAAFFSHTRFRLPADALLMAPAGWAACRVWRRATRTADGPGRIL